MAEENLNQALESRINLVIDKQRAEQSLKAKMVVAYCIVGVIAMFGGIFSFLVGIVVFWIAGKIADNTKPSPPDFQLNYEDEEGTAARLLKLNSVCQSLADVPKATSRSNVVSMTQVKAMPHIKTDVTVWSMSDSQTILYFLPDSLLAWDEDKYIVRPYHSIECNCQDRSTDATPIQRLEYPESWGECALVTLSDGSGTFFKFLVSDRRAAERFCEVLSDN
ncbi:MAG: hypothetical protein JST01_11695 [Cyanobacteria bacterium SZAS TMP-1]|nr:hypothetical protein [Cyanobacteria bacterium SZAS TMP-1]